MHLESLKLMTSPSSLLLQGVKESSELEHIGIVGDKIINYINNYGLFPPLTMVQLPQN